MDTDTTDVLLTLSEPLLTRDELAACPLSDRYEEQLREVCRSFHHRGGRSGDSPGKPVGRPRPKPKPVPAGG